MDNRKKYFSSRFLLGWVLLAAGVVVAVLGILIGKVYADQPYNFGIITALGILLVGIGVNNLVRYGAALKDEQSARRLMVEERDERTVLMRARAGNRAYWVTATLVYAGLLWESFAANGNVPALKGDALWYFFAGAVLIPFAVYVVSILIDQRIS